LFLIYIEKPKESAESKQIDSLGDMLPRFEKQVHVKEGRHSLDLLEVLAVVLNQHALDIALDKNQSTVTKVIKRLK
jgi:hypothetical protein